MNLREHEILDLSEEDMELESMSDEEFWFIMRGNLPHDNQYSEQAVWTPGLYED